MEGLGQLEGFSWLGSSLGVSIVFSWLVSLPLHDFAVGVMCVCVCVCVCEGTSA